MMLYLLDANVLITASNLYYPLNAVPEFWDWILHVAESGKVKIPVECFDEVKAGNRRDERDLLFSWIQDPANKQALLLDEEVDATLVQRAVYDGYAPDLTDDEIEEIGHDPFLIAYALKDPTNRCVITTEQSKPSRKRQNRHVPDVCNDLDVQCYNQYKLNQELGFSTSWSRRVGS